MPAGRKPTPPAKAATVPVDEALIADDRAALNQLAVIERQASERVTALAQQLNYQGSTDPAVLENSARDAIGRIGMGIFELGGYLLLMKEACAHGTFLPALERLGLGVDAAGRYMAVTRRFANSVSTRNLAPLGVTKLVELLPLDDEQMADLTGLGETGELALDKVATMSVRELRAAVREARAELQATEKVLADKSAANDKLRRQLKRMADVDPDQVQKELIVEATARFDESLGYVRGHLRAALAALHDNDATANKQFMAGMVGQLLQELMVLRDEFSLPDVVGDGRPEWQRWADAQDAALGGAGATPAA